MKLTIKPNPNNEMYKRVKEAVKQNDGYCPCLLERTSDTKCMCKAFREQSVPGACLCGLFIKEEGE